MSGHKVFFIAEAGVNHNGDINIAKQLIHVAAESGADAVKFQTFKAELLVSKDAPKADYQKLHTPGEESQYAMLKKLELSHSDHYELFEECCKCNIEFMSTPFDVESATFLHELGVKRFKIPSGEITNYPYLKHVAQLKLPVIFSTGMSDFDDVRNCYNVLTRFGLTPEMITVLHCNTMYPTPFTDVNLLAMPELGKSLGVNFGYSDHTLGNDVSIAASALGATVIEKHFSMSREMPGPDHSSSLEPTELAQLIHSIRNISVALGTDVKRVSASESSNRLVARKSIVAARAIKAGEIFTADNLSVKRPGTGINPMRWDEIVGQKAKRDFKEDEIIEE